MPNYNESAEASGSKINKHPLASPISPGQCI